MNNSANLSSAPPSVNNTKVVVEVMLFCGTNKFIKLDGYDIIQILNMQPTSPTHDCAWYTLVKNPAKAGFKQSLTQSQRAELAVIANITVSQDLENEKRKRDEHIHQQTKILQILAALNAGRVPLSNRVKPSWLNPQEFFNDIGNIANWQYCESESDLKDFLKNFQEDLKYTQSNITAANKTIANFEKLLAGGIEWYEYTIDTQVTMCCKPI